MTGPPIPDDWTGEEALRVAAFLRHLANAIWDRHGDRMGRALEQRYAQHTQSVGCQRFVFLQDVALTF